MSSDVLTADAPTGQAEPEDGQQRWHRRAAAEAERMPGGRVGTAALFLIPAALTLTTCLNRLSQRQLWRDEHASWWAASLSLNDLSKLIHNVDLVLLPYYLLLHFWIDLFGTSPAALRLPSAIAMAVAAGWLALLGRRLFTTRVGMLAGLLLAAVPTITRYGQEARPYAFAVLAAVASTHLLLLALDRPRFKSWILYAASVPVLGWSHLVSLTLLAAHAAFVLRTGRKGDRVQLWAFGAAATAGVSLTAPMVLQGSQQSGQIAWNDKTTLHDLLNYPTTLFLSWHLAAGVMLVGLLGLLVSGRRVLLLGTWALLPPIAAFATTTQLHLFLPRYLIFTLPAWALLAAAAVGRIAGPLNRTARVNRVRQVFGWLLVAAVAAGGAWVARPDVRLVHNDLADEPDYAGLTRLLLQRQKPGDGIVYSGTLMERMSLGYELRDARTAPRDVLLSRSAGKAGLFSALECVDPDGCAASTNRIWLVSTSPTGDPFLGMTPKAADVMKTQFRIDGMDTLRHVKLILLTRDHPSKHAALGAGDLQDHTVQMPGNQKH